MPLADFWDKAEGGRELIEPKQSCSAKKKVYCALYHSSKKLFALKQKKKYCKMQSVLRQFTVNQMSHMLLQHIRNINRNWFFFNIIQIRFLHVLIFAFAITHSLIASLCFSLSQFLILLDSHWIIKLSKKKKKCNYNLMHFLSSLIDFSFAHVQYRTRSKISEKTPPRLNSQASVRTCSTWSRWFTQNMRLLL